MNGEERELTRDECNAIRELVVSSCANYDQEYGCLPLENPCYMLGKCWTGSYCKYFREALLPTNPVLGATLTGRETPVQDMCASCGEPFIPVGKQFYCSEACQNEGNRHKSRERMRKKRNK